MLRGGKGGDGLANRLAKREGLALEDLSKEELLLLIKSYCLFMPTTSDIYRARWKRLSLQAQKLMEEVIEGHEHNPYPAGITDPVKWHLAQAKHDSESAKLDVKWVKAERMIREAKRIYKLMEACGAKHCMPDEQAEVEAAKEEADQPLQEE